MATQELIDELRRATDVVDTAEPYTDAFMGMLIDREGSVDAAAYVVWRGKAAEYAKLVNTTEGASSRQMGQLHDHAMKMIELYGRLSTVDTAIETSPFTVGIERV
jgi:hypothetical protein